MDRDQLYVIFDTITILIFLTPISLSPIVAFIIGDRLYKKYDFEGTAEIIKNPYIDQAIAEGQQIITDGEYPDDDDMSTRSDYIVTDPNMNYMDFNVYYEYYANGIRVNTKQQVEIYEILHESGRKKITCSSQDYEVMNRLYPIGKKESIKYCSDNIEKYYFTSKKKQFDFYIPAIVLGGSVLIVGIVIGIVLIFI